MFGAQLLGQVEKTIINKLCVIVCLIREVCFGSFCFREFQLDSLLEVELENEEEKADSNEAISSGIV